jgi:hypothetical protein
MAKIVPCYSWSFNFFCFLNTIFIPICYLRSSCIFAYYANKQGTHYGILRSVKMVYFQVHI